MGDAETALASAKESLTAFGPEFEAARAAGLRRKLGLVTEREGDAALAVDLLKRMAENRADFALTFRRLCDAAEGPEGDEGVWVLFADPGAYDAWAAAWRHRLEQEPISAPVRAAAMRMTNPAFIPRTTSASSPRRRDRAAGLPTLRGIAGRRVTSLRRQARPGADTTPALPEECVTQTFCGT